MTVMMMFCMKSDDDDSTSWLGRVIFDFLYYMVCQGQNFPTDQVNLIQLQYQFTNLILTPNFLWYVWYQEAYNLSSGWSESAWSQWWMISVLIISGVNDLSVNNLRGEWSQCWDHFNYISLILQWSQPQWF